MKNRIHRLCRLAPLTLLGLALLAPSRPANAATNTLSSVAGISYRTDPYGQSWCYCDYQGNLALSQPNPNLDAPGVLLYVNNTLDSAAPYCQPRTGSTTIWDYHGPSTSMYYHGGTFQVYTKGSWMVKGSYPPQYVTAYSSTVTWNP